MKHRTPLSFEDALIKVLGAVTRQAAAEAVGKSSTMVYRWADPDCSTEPSLVECVILDRLYVEGGHGEAPILASYQRHLENVRTSHIAMKASERLCDVMHELGDIANEVRRCIDPDSDGGEAITKEEHSRISTEISEAMQNLTKLQRDIDHAANLDNLTLIGRPKEAS